MKPVYHDLAVAINHKKTEYAGLKEFILSNKLEQNSFALIFFSTHENKILLPTLSQPNWVSHLVIASLTGDIIYND